MTFEQYTQFALMTNQRDYAILAKRLQTSPDVVKIDTYHAALGVVTEVGELNDGLKKSVFYGRDDKVNAAEEIGDCFWYLAILANAWGLHLGDFAEVEPGEVSIDHYSLPRHYAMLAKDAGELLAMVADGTFNGQGLVLADFERLATRIVFKLRRACSILNVPVEKVLEANVLKLQKRYGAGHFTPEHANARNVAAEQAVLEEKLVKPDFGVPQVTQEELAELWVLDPKSAEEIARCWRQIGQLQAVKD